MEKVDRLRQVFNYIKSIGLVHTQKDLAERMQASEATVSKALRGDEQILTSSFLRRLNRAFDNVFNSKWLLNGEGDMFNKDINISQTIDTNTGVITNNIGGEDNSRSTTNTTNNTTNNYAECEKANTSSKLLGMAIEEISEQRKLVSKAQEQIDRLITLLEKK